jgi:hypothetical protein
MQASSGLRVAGVALAACMAASPQSLLSPDAADQARKDFALAATDPRLRCVIAPVRPALSYRLQFQTGYVIDVPLTQLHGQGHGLKVLLRVTPEGGAPAYLTGSELLPEVPETSGDGEFTEAFSVGEGKYLVETLAQDDAGRVCSNKWRIEAKRTGSERSLRGAMPPGAVGEVSPAWSSASRAAGARIERLTILLDATPLNPRAAKLEEETAAMLRDSVGSLLDQLPAKRVRLVAFNPDQQAVLLEKDGFGARDLEQLTTAFDQLQVAAVDYRKLQSGQKTDVVGNLVVRELRDPHPASAVIFLGPRTSWKADASLEPAPGSAGAARPRWFYLEFQRPPEWPLGSLQRSRQGGGRAGRAMNPGMPTSADDSEPVGPLRFGAGPDWIEQWLRRLKGETLVIHNPHDLADAIRRMTTEIPKTASAVEPEAQAPAPAAMPPQRPFLLGSSDPDVADEIKVAPRSDALETADPIEVLMRLRDQVLAHGLKVPNHTCVETVERDVYEPVVAPGVASCEALLAWRRLGDPGLRRNTTDRLRLDVGLAGGQEVFSWAGALRFEDRDLDELVPENAIVDGSIRRYAVGRL